MNKIEKLKKFTETNYQDHIYIILLREERWKYWATNSIHNPFYDKFDYISWLGVKNLKYFLSEKQKYINTREDTRIFLKNRLRKINKEICELLDNK